MKFDHARPGQAQKLIELIVFIVIIGHVGVFARRRQDGATVEARTRAMDFKDDYSDSRSLKS